LWAESDRTVSVKSFAGSCVNSSSGAAPPSACDVALMKTHRPRARIRVA